MTKVEASLPLLAKEGCLTNKQNYYYEKATLSCLVDKRGQQLNKKNNL